MANDAAQLNAKELRAKVKKCMNALSNQPIAWGEEKDKLVKDAVDSSLYVEHLHGSKDLIQALADQVDFDEGGGTYLFTGNRGTGKTTELLRLAERLKTDFDCEVFYVNMQDYLNLTMPVEITDFLISVLGGFSEKIKDRYHADPSKIGFFDRMGNFLNSNVQIAGFKIPIAGADLSATMQQDPVFKKKLQEGMRGHVTKLMEDARKFVGEAVEMVHSCTRPNKKIVLIVDTLEQLGGLSDFKDIPEVFQSAATLFSGHADKLRFQSLHLICTVPPYLSAVAGGLSALYSGGRIFTLPSVHIYEKRPDVGNNPVKSTAGLALMRDIIGRRIPEWKEFFTEAQLFRLAEHSGGDLRDFIRMVRLCIAQALDQKLPLPDEVLDDAESALRNDMPLANDDREWLKKIQKSHERELDSLDKLPIFARLLESKFILNYRNGEDWYDVHPLLRSTIAEGG